jgi:hypothetical protein
MHCTDGIVIGADTLWFTSPARGTPLNPSTRTKLHWIDERTVYVVAGSFASLYALEATPRLPVLRGRPFDETGDAAYELLYGALDLSGDDPGECDLVIARVDANGPAVGFRTRQDDSITRAEPGRVVGAGTGMMGWPAKIGHEHWVDLNVEAAVPVLYGMIYGYIRDLYHRMGYERLDDFAARGEGWPSVAFPIQIATLTAEGSKTEGFAEPTLEEGDRLLAAMQVTVNPKRAVPRPPGPL